MRLSSLQEKGINGTLNDFNFSILYLHERLEKATPVCFSTQAKYKDSMQTDNYMKINYMKLINIIKKIEKKY